MSLFYHNASLSILGIPYYEQIAHDETYEQKVYDDLLTVINQRDDHTRPWWWFQRELEQEPVPPKKRSELEKSQKPPWDLWYSTFLYVIHLETFWWIETNVTEYIQNRRFIWPHWDKESLESPVAWKRYYVELKQRLLTPWMKYQATWMFVFGFQRFLENGLVSHETMLLLNQHPPRRAMAIAERDSDLLQRGFDVFVANIWGNVIFFMANYAVEQIGVLYGYYYYNKRVLEHEQSCQEQNPDQDEQDLVVLVNTSWSLLVINSRRLFYSAAGAGLGSIMFDPGWGTLVGLGIGDYYARRQMNSELPTPALTVILTWISDLVGIIR